MPVAPCILAWLCPCNTVHIEIWLTFLAFHDGLQETFWHLSNLSGHLNELSLLEQALIVYNSISH